MSLGLTAQESLLDGLLAGAPAAGPTPSLEECAVWLAHAAPAASAAAVPEGAAAACAWATVLLLGRGPLGRREDGSNLPWRQRVVLGRDATDQAAAALGSARARISRQIRKGEDLAGEAIRAAAEANILPPPTGMARDAWLREVRKRAGGHPKSAGPLVALALAVGDDEVLVLLDRVFRSRYGV